MARFQCGSGDMWRGFYMSFTSPCIGNADDVSKAVLVLAADVGGWLAADVGGMVGRRLTL